MRLSDIVVSGAIVTDLDATSRDDAIGELVDALVGAGVIAEGDRSTLIERVLERENKGSTGFGKGVAVPHVKHSAMTKMAAAVGLSRSGIEFHALDEQPVYTVFLLLSPAERPEEHLQAMEVIFKNLSKETFRHFLRQAEGVQDVTTLLDEADNHLLDG